MALLFTAAFFSALCLPMAARLGVSVGAVDLPDGGRKTHPRPTPRFSAPALYLGMAVALLAFAPDTPLRAALLTGGALMAVLGMTDDVSPLSPRLKLAAEIAVAAVPVGFGLFPTDLFLLGVRLSVPPLVACALVLLWVLAVENAYNMIDGLDGLAASQGLVTACALTALGTPSAMTVGGAMLGFLPYNLPARTAGGQRVTAAFLGDGGALLLGYSLALLALATPAWPTTLLFYAVPLYDLVTSVGRRLLHGRHPFAADGGHLHHRLRQRGLSSGGTVVLLLGAALLFSAIGLLLTANSLAAWA